MRWHLSLLAVGLLLTAGCSGFSATGSDAEPTVTPAPVPAPTDRTAPATETGPVSDTSVSVGKLADDHRDALANRSYTFREEFEAVTTVDGNTTRTTRRETTRVVNAARYRRDLDQTKTFPNGSVDSYSQSTYGANGRWYERRDDGTASYHSGQISFSRDKYAAEAAFYIGQYATFSGNTTRQYQWTGATRYRSVGGGDSLPTLNAPSEYRVSMLVDQNGLVRWFDVRYTVTVGNRTETVSYQFWYERVGTTDVTRPSWVDDRNWSG